MVVPIGTDSGSHAEVMQAARRVAGHSPGFVPLDWRLEVGKDERSGYRLMELKEIGSMTWQTAAGEQAWAGVSQQTPRVQPQRA